MDAGRPGSVVLTGSRKEEVYEWIDDRIPFPCVLLNDFEKYDDPGRMIYGVFCPGDNQELENMYRETGRDFLSSAVPSAVVLSFSPGTEIGFPVLLHKSDFAFKLFRRMTCSAMQQRTLIVSCGKEPVLFYPFSFITSTTFLQGSWGILNLLDFSAAGPIR
jgi:hypothetical protein